MRYAILFFGMALGYLILVINIRAALNRGKYLATGLTEFTYSLVQFGMIRSVAEAATWLESIAYAAGATVGSILAMWMTKHWDKEK